MTEFIFPFRQSLRDQFIAKNSALITDWAAKYRCLFDEMDVGTARSQAPVKESGRGGYHFYEWLAAILIYEATGLYSLVEGYQFKTNPRKLSVLAKLFTDSQQSLIQNRSNAFKAEAPDLLVYSRDYSSYFFCEVKGPGDTVQIEADRFCKAIEAACGKPVALARLVRCDTLLAESLP